MSKIFGFFISGIVTWSIAATAAEPAQQTPPPPVATKATYLITGLHCPPCTRTVESSLRKVKGVRSVTVNWKSKNARIEFDENALPAQKLAQAIAGTPHMMGGDMQYGGWLVLKVPKLDDDAAAKQVKEILSKVAGVKRVATYPTQHSVGVEFDAKGDLTSRELIEALDGAGIKADNF